LNYAARWKVFCEVVRERWVGESYVHNPYVVTWGSKQDSVRLLCPPKDRRKAKHWTRSRSICLMAVAKNYFYGQIGSAPCDLAREQAFVQENCL
jgi:hypothetical protein